MKTTLKNMLCTVILTSGVIAASNANAGSLPAITDNFAIDIQEQLNTTGNQHNVLAAKFILELTMGGNRDKAKKVDRTHATWCAKIHKSYDAASNTFTAPNGKQYPCLSLFQ